MRTIKIPFPDVTYYEKTRLEAASTKIKEFAVGQTSLLLRNPAGFAANDFMILEAFESEGAEIVQIKSIDKATRLADLEDQTYQPHAVGVVIMKTPYNQVKIFKGASSVISTHSLLATVDLRPDQAYTYYPDATGTTADYYSYQYFNSKANIAGTQTIFAESNYDSVLTVANLKDWFMFGLDLTDDDGYPFPNSMLEFAIRAAIGGLEKVLNVRIKPSHIIGERQDYYRQDYTDFGFIQLNEYPIFDITKVALRYPTAGSDITFPAEWYQINKAHGQVHLIPTSGSLSQILIGRGGDYLSFVWKGWDWMPNLWIIDYWAGFPPADHTYISAAAAANIPIQTGVPDDLIGVIGKMACFYPLNIAGDLVGGVAIASKSIGIDGLSQSINTTSSAENAGYSARLRQYERELKVEIPRLIAFYKGLRMAVC